MESARRAERIVQLDVLQEAMLTPGAAAAGDERSSHADLRGRVDRRLIDARAAVFEPSVDHRSRADDVKIAHLDVVLRFRQRERLGWQRELARAIRAVAGTVEAVPRGQGVVLRRLRVDPRIDFQDSVRRGD